MNRKFLTAAIACIGLAGVPSLPAGDISIDLLVNEALARNPELGFYRAAVGMARGERRTAGEWTNPEVEAEQGKGIRRSYPAVFHARPPPDEADSLRCLRSIVLLV